MLGRVRCACVGDFVEGESTGGFYCMDGDFGTTMLEHGIRIPRKSPVCELGRTL